MTYADERFISVCEEIIGNGISDEGMSVRPHWDDGTPAHTVKKFGVVNRYDLQKEFPIMTLRRTYWKSALDELLWIWQKKSNNIHELGSHIWDQWADETGSIGKAYGYQMLKKYPVNGIDPRKAEELFGREAVLYAAHLPRSGGMNAVLPWGEEDPSRESARYHAVAAEDGTVWMDQIDHILYDLRYNPASRRMIATTWNPADAAGMRLEPCAYSMTFNVSGNRLNAILNQRSQDMLAASNWNVVQYAFLLMITAQVSGFEPGELVHVIADCHIYDRHIPIVRELIGRKSDFTAPAVKLDPGIRNFYDVTRDSITVVGYEYLPFNVKIPIAV